MNRALLVGINNYPTSPLRGCVNDITDMANFLVSAVNFDKAEIRLLVDERATTDAIKERISWLTSGLKSGDRIFFHYSGHGAQYAPRDANGNVTSLHDVICPVDFDWSPQRMITDIDFKNLFANIPPGVEFNWVSDSCHSGDLARAILPENCRPRLFPTPADLQWRIDTAISQGIKSLGLGVIEHLNGALLAGCQSTETSADAYLNGRYNGAFTFTLMKGLQDPQGLNIPLTSLITEVQKALTSIGYSQQHPQLRGAPLITGKSFLHI